VDSLTIKSAPGGSSGLNSVGQLVEGVFRSINNLLEKFHQSFFFYLMPCTYRYISIGLYIPPFALMVAASLIQVIVDRLNRFVTCFDNSFDGIFLVNFF